MRVFLLLLLFQALTIFAGGRNITFDDLYGFPGFEDPQISPNGQQIVFVLRTNDLANNSRQSRLWLMNKDGGDLHQLNMSEGSAWNPRWDADGKSIWYLSSYDRNTQISRYWLESQDVQQVTRISSAVSEFEYYVPTNKILFVSEVFPDCRTDSCYNARTKELEDNEIKARLFDKLLFRHYSGWDNGMVNRLFILDVESGEYEALLSSPYNIPTTLLGGYCDYAVSPDGDEVCFAMSIDSLPAVLVNNDLYIMKNPGGILTALTVNPGLESSPRYSSDGRFLAYLATSRQGYESDQRDLIIYDRKSKKHTNLTEAFDLSIGYYQWDAKSKYVYFSAIEHGYSKIWRIDIKNGKFEILLDDAVYNYFYLSPDGEYLVVVRNLSNQPEELYCYRIKEKKLERLTTFTEKSVSELDLVRTEHFWFVGAMGDSVQGFLTRPPNFDPKNSYPLVLLIHGGPQWCWLDNFNYYGWNTQLTAAQGYVVATINSHGSLGYGIKFKEYVSGNWGRGDFDDIMMGVDYLLKNYPYIDSTRMAALGRSYGGFMTNWICGHTDRFKCLISIDGTSNNISDYGTTDELWFPEWEFKGTPWNNREEYERTSPILYAENFKTPTMVVHGQYDYRVDLSEALQMYTALQRMGVPSQLLYFPDEGHNIGKLANLRYVYKKQFEWLARWLK